MLTAPAPAASSTGPEVGELVRVRGQQWVVARVHHSAQPADELAATRSPARTLVTLSSVSPAIRAHLRDLVRLGTLQELALVTDNRS